MIRVQIDISSKMIENLIKLNPEEGIKTFEEAFVEGVQDDPTMQALEIEIDKVNASLV